MALFVVTRHRPDCCMLTVGIRYSKDEKFNPVCVMHQDDFADMFGNDLWAAVEAKLNSTPQTIPPSCRVGGDLEVL